MDKYKIGDIVQIKSYDEIKKTLNIGNHCRGIYFNRDDDFNMTSCCGQIYKISNVTSSALYDDEMVYSIVDSNGKGWSFVSEWLTTPYQNVLDDNLFVI